MHRYRTHTLWRSPRVRRRAARPPVRLVPSHPRPRRRAVHRPARPLRHDPMRGRSRFAGLRPAEKLRSEWVVRHRRRRAQAPRGHRERRTCRPAQIEVYVREIEVLGPAGDLPLPVFGDQPYPEDTRLQIPLPRSAPREAARNIMLRGRVVDSHARAHEGAGVLRVPDADPHRLQPRGRARLSRAVAHPSRQVLRAAAGAAAVQAAADDGGLRPLFPDRALFPRRGPARRPAARRILPARHRDELRRAGRRVRGDGAGDPRRVRGIRRAASR